ncbi:hypothetical protein ES707_11745 [subsurface metagenome]
MAGSGTISTTVINYHTIDCHYSCNISGSGRQGLIDIVDDPRVQFPEGHPLRYYLGAGPRSGTIRYTNYWPNRKYCFYLYDYKSDADHKRIASAYATTPGVPAPPPPTPTGTLSAEVVDPTTVKLNYSYQNGTNVSLFRGTTLLKTFGSGSGSGVYEDSGLEPETQYTYYLRNGTTTGAALLASATVGTPPLPAEGTLSSQTIDSATIDLTYSFSDGTNVSLFRGSERIKTFGSGAGSGTYRDGELSPDTSYTYYLRNGTTVDDILLATATGKTLKEARKAIIERGKILPLNSLLTIFDSTLKPLGILEDYEYLRWIFRFRKLGNFKLIINRYKANVQYLVKGNILAIYVAGYYRAAIIESIEIGLTEKGKISENYIIIGRGLGGLLAERKAENNISVGTGYDSQNTYAETAMRHYVNVNCMNATDPDRNYPLLFLESPDQERGGTIKYDARFQVISELLEEISLVSGLGWEIVLDPTNKRFVFKIIEGVDRSFDNGVNSPVTFSPKFGNIRLISYVDSNINSKNVATVAGQGEGADRIIVEVTKDGGTYTGMDRREVFIDARDLDTEDKLIQRGNERLAELGEEKVLEMENLATGPFSYGEDFYLGDIITEEYPGIVKADMRLIESIIEITPRDLIQNKLIFGKQFPDFININEYKNKNIYPEIRR